MNLTNESEAVALLESSGSAREWDENVDKIKEANGGYPMWWATAVIFSGLPGQVFSKWSEDCEIAIWTTIDEGFAIPITDT